MHKPRILGAALAAALLVAGCASSSATTAPSTAPTPPPATPTPAQTLPALPSGPLSSLSLPSFDLHAAPALEAMLPGTIGGQQLQKFSFSLAQLSAISQGTSDTDQAFMSWVQSLGKNPSDVNVAAGNTTADPKITVVAIQVAGADQAQMLTNFQQALQSKNITATQTTVGGKSVLQLSDPTQSGTTSYAYAKGDVLFMAQSTDATAAQTAVGALP